MLFFQTTWAVTQAWQHCGKMKGSGEEMQDRLHKSHLRILKVCCAPSPPPPQTASHTTTPIFNSLTQIINLIIDPQDLLSSSFVDKLHKTKDQLAVGVYKCA